MVVTMCQPVGVVNDVELLHLSLLSYDSFIIDKYLIMTTLCVDRGVVKTLSQDGVLF